MKNELDLLQQDHCVFKRCQQASDQQGVVLIISLILLLGVMVLSLTGMQTVVLNQRMASNAFEAEREDHWAESAVQYAKGRNDWLSQAIGYSESNAIPDLNALPDNAQWKVVDRFTRNVPSAPAVHVGMLARSGSVAGYSFDVDFQLIDVYGKTEAASAGANSNITVQGFLTIIPGGGQ